MQKKVNVVLAILFLVAGSYYLYSIVYKYKHIDKIEYSDVSDQDMLSVSDVEASDEVPAILAKPIQKNNKLAVVFGDHEVSVDLRERVLYGMDYNQSENGIDNYNLLSQKANQGDALAARVLAQELEICLDAFRDPEALQKAINLLRQTGSYKSYRDESKSIEIDVYGMEKWIAQMRGDYSRCKSIPVERFEEYEKYYEQAAQSGDFISLLVLTNLSQTSPEKHFQLIDKLWNEHGSIGSLAELAVINYNGNVPDGNGGYLPPDKITGNAYMLANLEVAAAAMVRDNPEIYSEIRTITDESISQIMTGLVLQEQQAVEKLAAEIIANNPQCCFQ